MSGSALLVGAALGFRLRIPTRVLGLVMAFGAGVLISALAFELTAEAHERGGATAVTLGLVAGGLVFFAGDRVIDMRGGEHRKRSGTQQAGGVGAALLLGALLDGIPESAAIGVSLMEGEGVGIAFVIAVFLSNLPEAASSASGMRATGRSARYVMGVWTVVALVSSLAAAVGFAVLGDASAGTVAFVQAFAAGAILTMLADTMMPEAFHDSGPLAGLTTLAGFACAFLLTTV